MHGRIVGASQCPLGRQDQDRVSPDRADEQVKGAGNAGGGLTCSGRLFKECRKETLFRQRHVETIYRR